MLFRTPWFVASNHFNPSAGSSGFAVSLVAILHRPRSGKHGSKAEGRQVKEKEREGPKSGLVLNRPSWQFWGKLPVYYYIRYTYAVRLASTTGSLDWTLSLVPLHLLPARTAVDRQVTPPPAV